MNKERRQELGEVIDYLDDAIVRLAEGLQNSRTGDSMLNAIDQLNGFCDDIEKVKAKVSDMMSNKKKK